MKIKDIGLYSKINGSYKQLVTVKEASVMLRMSRQNVLKHINKGNIRAVRIDISGGILYLIPKIDIKKIA